MSTLREVLQGINRQSANVPNNYIPYTIADVRSILITNAGFGKKYVFKSRLDPDVVQKLRSEGLDVTFDSDNLHTTVSWQ